MGCCNVRELEDEQLNINIIDSGRAEKIVKKQQQINEEIKIDHKNSIGDRLSTMNNSDLDYIQKSQAGGVRRDDKSLTILTNAYQSNDVSNVKIMPKSFIDASNPPGIWEEQPIFAPKQFSSSFTSQRNIRYRNNVQSDYMTNIKYCVKSKVIVEKESKAEESNNQRETVENIQTTNKNLNTNTGTMNHTLVLNSIENDIFPTESNRESSHQKILVKHSLRKNKSPRFLKPLKKNALKPGNNTEIIEMPEDQMSSFICNKATLSKYRYLFADDYDDAPSMRNNFRKCHTKNLTQLEDSDFTSLQKFGTIYSTNKTNSSHVDDVKMSFNSVSKKNPFGNPQSNRDNKGN